MVCQGGGGAPRWMYTNVREKAANGGGLKVRDRTTVSHSPLRRPGSPMFLQWSPGFTHEMVWTSPVRRRARYCIVVLLGIRVVAAVSTLRGFHRGWMRLLWCNGGLPGWPGVTVAFVV